MGAPLQNVRIVEFESLGPGPLAGRMLMDMGAQVTVIVRAGQFRLHELLGVGDSPLRIGKRVLTLDLKSRDDIEQAFQLVTKADALIEGNRPGVMERLGLGPAECLARNRKLVYGRLTGWGQQGPLRHVAGHDLNYVALTGLLSLSARHAERPIVPPTVVGDAAGALGLAFGVVCALFDARTTGQGRVVDAAIVDVVAMLGGLVQWLHATGQIGGDQPSPFYDSPFYDVYECSDGRYITICALEPQFYALLLEKMGLDDINPALQYDRATWPALKSRFVALFRSHPRSFWCTQLEGTDVCFAPVLSLSEAAGHPHNVSRRIFSVAQGGQIRPSGAPRCDLPNRGNSLADS
jgi:alpha-methylacyl-CoA racemase